MKVKKDEFITDGGKSAMMTTTLMRFVVGVFIPFYSVKYW